MNTIGKRILAGVLCAILMVSPLTSCAPSSPSEKEKEMTIIPLDDAIRVDSASADIPEALRQITVSNDTAKRGVIASDSTFTIRTGGETTAEELSRYLRISPLADMEITGEGTEFTMRPRTALEANTLYRFSVADTMAESPALLTAASFVFQTEDAPRVTGMFPADRATNVPTNTGIEFTLNEVLNDTADLSQYITVAPAVDFRVEVYQHGRTLVVIPDKKLAEGEAYTVTLAAGVPLASGRATAAPATTTFRTVYDASESKTTMGYHAREITAYPGECADLSYYIYTKNGDTSVTPDDTVCTVYRYRDAAAAAAALVAYEEQAGRFVLPGKEYVFPTDDLKKVGTYTLTTQTGGATYRPKYTVSLPALEAGCYLIGFTASGRTGLSSYSFDGQVILQVTDLAVTTVSSGEDLVLWLQNGAGAVAGADVNAYLYDRVSGWSLRAREDGADTVAIRSGTSDENGLCRIDTAGRTSALAVITSGDASRYVCIGATLTDASRHRVYIYTDREEYFPSDTVNFWGVITPAEGIGTLTYTSNAAAGGTVTVSPDGTFRGSLPYADFAGYGVSLSFADEAGNSVASAYKSITREEKPVYTATVSFDQPFYTRGEAIRTTLSVTFFDGTPAGGLRFLYNSYGFGGKGEVVTDENGTATVTLRESGLRAHSTDPVYGNIYFELIGDEWSSLYVPGSFLYFHSDYVWDSAREKDGVHLTLHHLDTTALTDMASYYTVREQLKGDPAEGRVSVTLRRRWSVQVPGRTYYDPITKQNQTTYRYESREEVLRTFTEAFADGVIVLSYVENPIAGSHYQYEITYNDGVRTFKQYAAATYYEYENSPADGDRYELRTIREDGTVTTDPSGAYVPNETARFAVYNNGEVLADKYRTLFVVMTPDGIADVRVAEDNATSVSFAGDRIPYARIAAVVSDGRTDVAALTSDMMYDFERLNQLTVTVDAAVHKALPGETVDVTVTVTDPDGHPVPGAEVLLSVVDEACFAMQNQTLEAGTPLRSLIRFRTIRHGINKRYSVFDGSTRFTYLSSESKDMVATAAPSAEAPAENESVGSDTYVRSVFADNPLFDTVRTDENGRAVIAAKLPDNITTWRLSAIASEREGDNISPVDVMMGASRDAVVVTLPFFINTTAEKVYIAGDDIAMNAKVSGVGDFANAEFTAELTDAAGRVIGTERGKGVKFASVPFNFGVVPAGEYAVTVTARAGEYADALRQTFTVVDSAVLLRVNKLIPPAEAMTLNPSLYPLTLTFVDTSHTLVGGAVDRILSGRNGRTDSKAAYLAALLVCEKLYGASQLYAEEIDTLLAEMNGVHGGYRIYSYAEEDPVMTAKICLLLSHQLSHSAKESLAAYLSQSVLSAQDARSLAASLMGLAALDQPVLGDLYYARDHLDEMKDADAVARLYLATAFAAIGDRGNALSLYADVAAILRTEEDGEVYFAGDTLEDALEITYAALLCASLTQPAEAEVLMEYLSRRTSAYEMYALESAVFACAYAPDSYIPQTVTYLLDGESHTVELSGRRAASVTLHRDNYADFRITEVTEGVAVRAMYWGAPAEASARMAENVSVEKTVTPVSGKPDFYRVTVTVRGTTDRDSYYASITDPIPSGASFVRLENSSFTGSDKHTYGWMYENAGQMEGYLYVGNYGTPTTAGRREKSFTATYSYVIRAYTKGTFVVESAFVIDRASNTVAASDRAKISFK